MSEKDQINTGGAAFPSMYDQTFEQNFGHEAGMTLRDYFAAKAMSAVANGYWSNPNMSGLSPHNIADEAYQLADAMIAARGGAQ